MYVVGRKDICCGKVENADIEGLRSRGLASTLSTVIGGLINAPLSGMKLGKAGD